MNLNQLKKPALEKLAEERKADKESRRLQQVGERKRRIAWLKNKLAAWGLDVTYWRYTQFKVGDHLFVMRKDSQHYRYELRARAKCEHCKAVRDSFAINTLLDLGRALVGDYWAYHQCSPKPRAAVPQGPTREQRAYNLFAELFDLVGNAEKLRKGG